MKTDNTMSNLQILEKCFKEGMVNKDFEAFKTTHPTLLTVVLNAMGESSEAKDQEIKKLEEQLKAADAREQSIIEAIEEEISALDGVYKAPYIEGVQAGYTDSIEIIKNQPKQ